MSSNKFRRAGSSNYQEKYCCKKCGRELDKYKNHDGVCECGWRNNWFSKRGFVPTKFASTQMRSKFVKSKVKRLRRRAEKVQVDPDNICIKYAVNCYYAYDEGSDNRIVIILSEKDKAEKYVEILNDMMKYLLYSCEDKDEIRRQVSNLDPNWNIPSAWCATYSVKEVKEVN